MIEKEILKQIDNLLDVTHDRIEILNIKGYNKEIKDKTNLNNLTLFYLGIQTIMKNYEKVLEIEHFKQTEI